MVLQRLLLLLPETDPGWAWFWWAALVGGGLLLWLAGGRVSRSLVTLMLVAAGAILGKHFPAMSGAKLDPMACVLGGALVLGVLGYLMHRWVIGLGLGGVLGLWAVLGCFAVAASPAYFAWPGGGSLTEVYRSVVGQFTAETGQMMTAIGGLAFVSGMAVSVLFPRFAITLFWTLAGATVWGGSGLAWGFYQGPDRLSRLPVTTWGQCVLLGAIVVAGFAAQWWQGPGPIKASKPAPAPAPAVA